MPSDIANQPVRVLHLEDSENDQILVREMARAAGLNCKLVAVQTRHDFESALRQNEFDLIISDYSLPSFDGLSGLAIARELKPKTPFIFFSGTIGEESAVESLKKGAVDYVIKQRPHRLVPAIQQALRNAAERALLERAEQKNREQAELLDKATDAILVCDPEKRIVYWNRSAERIYGWTADEATGKDIVQVLFHGKPSPAVEEMMKVVKERGEWTGELHEFTKDDRPVIVQGRATLIHNEQGQTKSLLFINTDITERKQLEEQFLRAQRMESLGAMISGIAHDLNNALAPITIGVNILRKSPDLKENILKTMESSAKRGADMIKQVLAFVRGGDTQKARIQIEPLVKEMSKIITDTFPKNIRYEIKIGKELWPIHGVPTQLYQVLLNLCVNARDAMPDGGTLVLAVENVRLDTNAAANHSDAKPGDYVSISVTDTGTGISEEQMGKIFQPFFTTKAAGVGTGLGLPTSLSIIKNHGGFLTVQSKVGQGTEFKFYLPAFGEISPPPNLALPTGNGEVILFVDDEAITLVIALTILENYGYQVLTATNGLEAITRLSEKSHAIDLIIANLDMPDMRSGSTAVALRKIKPDIKIIATGETEAQTNNVKERVNINGFIAKPFTSKKLLTLIHEALLQKGK